MDLSLKKHMRGIGEEMMMREEVTERGRKGERDHFPLMEQASAMLFPLITLMTNFEAA